MTDSRQALVEAAAEAISHDYYDDPQWKKPGHHELGLAEIALDALLAHPDLLRAALGDDDEVGVGDIGIKHPAGKDRSFWLLCSDGMAYEWGVAEIEVFVRPPAALHASGDGQQ